MARTDLALSLRRRLGLERWARGEGQSVDQVRETLARSSSHASLRPTRRAFLRGGTAFASALAAGWQPGCRAGKGEPTIAIVGGGLAGLTAALNLADAGYASTIYEANPVKVGGRAITDRGSAQRPGSDDACSVCHMPMSFGDDGVWDDGQNTDMFGELIDTGHATMRALARRFDLPLLDAFTSRPDGATDTYFFGDDYYTKVEADADFAALFSAIEADVAAAGYPTSWDTSTAAGRALDDTSLHAWIASRVPGGHDSPLGKVLDLAYAIEFGADTTDQSCLNMLYLLGYGPTDTFSAFGASDERFHVKGGVGQIPDAIAAELGRDATIKLGYWLESLRRRSDDRYELTFAVDGAGVQTVTADLVILCLPFAVLRGLDIGEAGFDPRKLAAIDELGAGRNGKLQLQFQSRLWNTQGPWGLGTGASYSDRGYQCTWEATEGQPGASGVLVKYTGGSPVDRLTQAHPYGNATDPNVVNDALQFLDELEPVFPGIGAAWSGRVAGSLAHLNPRFGCSYSYWRVGQYQRFAGYEREPQGEVYFAGEHTALNYQGWMEGAAISGQREALRILERLA